MGNMKWQMAWALAEGERERWRGEWVKWEGGRILYPVEPLFREHPQDQGKWSLNRSEVSPKWWLSWAYLIININQKINYFLLFCLRSCCCHYFKQLDNACCS